MKDMTPHTSCIQFDCIDPFLLASVLFLICNCFAVTRTLNGMYCLCTCRRARGTISLYLSQLFKTTLSGTKWPRSWLLWPHTCSTILLQWVEATQLKCPQFAVTVVPHHVWFSLVMQRGMLPTTSTPVSMVTNVGGGGGGGPHCKFPGCAKPCYKEPSGRVHEFCGRTHAQQYMASKSTT